MVKLRHFSTRKLACSEAELLNYPIKLCMSDGSRYYVERGVAPRTREGPSYH